ncbi:MAG: flagellar type III secretion system pore protein FliP [Planctomycetota bacterium]
MIDLLPTQFRKVLIPSVFWILLSGISLGQDLSESWQSPGSSNLIASQGDTYSPDNFVRSQIGLASYQEESKSTIADNKIPASNSGQASFSDMVPFVDLNDRAKVNSTIQTVLLISILSLAPAILLMATSYIRIIVVLTLLKQAFGAQQLPPNQVMTALALFMTILIMAPVWNDVKQNAIDPYVQEDGISLQEAWDRGNVPIKNFMVNQILASGNDQAIAIFYRYLPAENSNYENRRRPPKEPAVKIADLKNAPINVILPAFIVSELKVAFLLGFQIYLPFLVLDLVVSAVTVSSGMLMLPPTMVSFPLKLFLFVLVDGWNLVVGMLLQSFQLIS